MDKTIVRFLGEGRQELKTKAGQEGFRKSLEAYLVEADGVVKNSGGDEYTKALRAQAKKNGKPLYKLAQDCLKLCGEKKDADQGIFFYGASRCLHVLAPMIGFIDFGPLGLERVLYHAISRGAELKQYQDALFFLALLGSRLSSTHGDPSADGKRGSHEDDDDDWGAAPIMMNVSPPPTNGKGHGNRSSGSGRPSTRNTTFNFPAPDGGCCEGTLVKLVAGAILNGVRCLVDSPPEYLQQYAGGDHPSVVLVSFSRLGQQWIRRLEEVKEEELATTYSERLWRLLWKAAEALDASSDSQTGRFALDIQIAALELLASHRVSMVVSQVYRSGLVYEKKASDLSKEDQQEIWRRILGLYREALTRIDSLGAKEDLAVLRLSGDYLDWMKHYSTTCQRLDCTQDGVDVLDRAYHAVSKAPSSKAKGDVHHLVLAILQLYRHALLQSSTVDSRQAIATSAITDSLRRSLEHLNKSQAMALKGDEKDFPRDYVIKAWRALCRLPHIVPIQPITEALGGGGDAGDGSDPNVQEWAITTFHGFLALVKLSPVVIAFYNTSPPEASPRPGSGPADTNATSSIKAGPILFDALVRSAGILISCLPDLSIIQKLVKGTCLQDLEGDKEKKKIKNPKNGGGGDDLHRAYSAISWCLMSSEPFLTNDASIRRTASAWFSLGKALADTSHPLLGLGPVLRSCHLLFSRVVAYASTTDSYLEACRVTQLDLRYATLATHLEEAGLRQLAASAILHSLRTSPSILASNISPSSSSSCQPSHFYSLARRFFRYKFAVESDLSLDNVGENLGLPWVLPLLQTQSEDEMQSFSLPHEALVGLEHASVAAVTKVIREEIMACHAYLSTLIKTRAEESVIASCMEAHFKAQRALVSKEEPADKLWRAIQIARLCRLVVRSGFRPAMVVLGKELGMEEKGEEDRPTRIIRMCRDELDEGIRAFDGANSRRGGESKGHDNAEAPTELYTLAVGWCYKGLLCLDLGEVLSGHESLLEGLEQWQNLASGGAGPAPCVGFVEKALVRHSLDILGDSFIGQGPTECQAKVVAVAASLSQWDGEGDGEDEVALDSCLCCLYLRAGLVELANEHLTRAQSRLRKQRKGKQSPACSWAYAKSLYEVADAFIAAYEEDWPFSQARARLETSLSKAKALAKDRTAHEVLPPRALSLVQTLALLCCADLCQGAGDVYLAHTRLKEVASTCQGNFQDEEREERGGGGGRQRESTRSRPSHEGEGEMGSRRLMSWVNTWRSSTWPLAECLLRIGEGWELLGGHAKADHYYRKATEFAEQDKAVMMHRRGLLHQAALALGEKDWQKAQEVLEEVQTNYHHSLAVRHSDDCLDWARLHILKGDLRRRQGDIQEAAKLYQAGDEALSRGMEGSRPMCTPILAGLRWRQAQVAWILRGDEEETEKLLLQSLEAPGGSTLDRAVANYRLGRVYASAVSDKSVRRKKDEPCPHCQAMNTFYQALVYSRSCRAPRVYRKAARAMVVLECMVRHKCCDHGRLGPEAKAFLVSTSVGNTFWNLLSYSRASDGDEEGGYKANNQDIDQPLTDPNALEGSFIKEMKAWQQRLPPDWVVCTVCVAPGKSHLLLSRVQGERTPITVAMPLEGGAGESSLLGQVLDSFDDIMDKSRRSLRGHSMEDVAGWGKKEKANWWIERETLDRELGSVLSRLESLLGPWKWLICGTPRDETERARVDVGVAAAREVLRLEAPRMDWLAGFDDWLFGLSCGLVGSEDKEKRRQEAAEAMRAMMDTMMEASQKEDQSVIKAATEELLRALEEGGSDTCKEEAPSKTYDVDDLVTDFSKLTVVQLKKELQSRSLPVTGSKSILVNRLTEAMAAEAQPSADDQHQEGPSSTTITMTSRSPVILALDEDLQRLPWESMGLLRSHPTSRCPSLPFVIQALDRLAPGDEKMIQTSNKKSSKIRVTAPLQGPTVSLHGGFYVLDPESNLAHTRATLEPILHQIQESYPGWQGIVGEPPTPEAFRDHLTRSQVFIYCGHGSGELFLCREEVAVLGSCPAAILMGCSSGRLKSRGDFEPSGMVYAYLHGGSPAVVANLWDVTDKDIDRFSIALLNQLLPTASMASSSITNTVSLLDAISQARSACKLPYLIGASPVCYGLPIRFLSEAPDPPTKGPSRRGEGRKKE